MRLGLYQKLAWQGMRKNHKTYLPYILTCAGITMMNYIMIYLATTPSLNEIRGGSSIQEILSFGNIVVAVFAVVFLFYTNSFIIRRRKKELGLYNILGMDKGNIGKILLWETIFIFTISVVSGLGCGILFSKLVELFAVKLMHSTVSFAFFISPEAITKTVILMGIIFVLILLYSLIQISISNPISLLSGDKVGEKPPRSRWLIAVFGLAMLVVAYYLSVTIKHPMQALFTFFIAVLLVIAATYLLFTVGSVALCKFLQNNKKYYYQKKHFVSVSSMAYRMNRNGISLATICILSTMILVMISSTFCLYIGVDDSLSSSHKRDIEMESFTSENHAAQRVRDIADETLLEAGITPKNPLHYEDLSFAALQENNKFLGDGSSSSMNDFARVKSFYILTVKEYNRLTNSSETLESNEVLLHCSDEKYEYDTINILNYGDMNVKKEIPEFMSNSNGIIAEMYIIVPDDTVLEELFEMQENYSFIKNYYGFDLDCDDAEKLNIQNSIQNKLSAMELEDESFPPVLLSSIASKKIDFYATYSGLFLLGIILSIVFISAAVLIMYYKQISEGYEDGDRFEIMQKVGMTKKEIKSSINSQILTVFLMPLFVAGMHITFAFPIIFKMLQMFGFFNQNLFIIVMAVCFVVFALFYIIVYKITSRSYYQIVSNFSRTTNS